MTIKYRMHDNRSVFGSKLKKKKKNSSNKSSFGPYVKTVTFERTGRELRGEGVEIRRRHGNRSDNFEGKAESEISRRDFHRNEGWFWRRRHGLYSVSFQRATLSNLEVDSRLPFVGMTYVMKQATERMKTTKVN